MLKTLSLVCGMVVMLGGTVVGVESRYGKALEVKANATEIQRIRLEQRMMRVQQRIWSLEDQFGFDLSKYPDRYRSEYRSLMAELESLKRAIDRL